MSQDYWKKCSSCKKELPYSGTYYKCSVSTCNHKRKGYQFCSVDCWDAHLGFANHRESWSIEAKAPSKAEVLAAPKPSGEVRRQPKTARAIRGGGAPLSAAREPRRQVIGRTHAPVAGTKIDTDTLVVVSKVKQLIKDQSGMNTSQCCIDALTKKVVSECLSAIENAKKAERKTVMGRDIE